MKPILAGLALVASMTGAAAGTVRTFSPAEGWETGVWQPCSACSATVAAGSFHAVLPAGGIVVVGESRGRARDLSRETTLLVQVRAGDQETVDAAPYLIVELDAEQNGELASGCSFVLKLDDLAAGEWRFASVPISAVECNAIYGVQDLARVGLVKVQVYGDPGRGISLEVGAVGTIQ